MRTGIIAEGKSDLAIITNILKGALGIDRSDVIYLIPELEYDETDLAQMRPEQFSNWSIVKQKCTERDGSVINQFFQIDDNRFLVIHIDTAECEEYGVKRPENKGEVYVAEIRDAVTQEMKEWLGGDINDRITFAVAVEETEAWLLTTYDNIQADTGTLPNPKERFERNFERLLKPKERRIITNLNAFDKAYKQSRVFRRKSELERFCAKNASLKAFFDALMNFAPADSTI